MFNYASGHLINRSERGILLKSLSCHAMFYALPRRLINPSDLGDTSRGSLTMSNMFNGASVFNQRDRILEDFSGDFHVVTCSSLALAFNQPIGSWDTSHVNTMKGMFFNVSAFNQPIGSWNTSQITDMRGMFSFASSFNQSDRILEDFSGHFHGFHVLQCLGI